MTWAGHVERMEKTNANTIFGGGLKTCGYIGR
jgi:hypothetical protein